MTEYLKKRFSVPMSSGDVSAEKLEENWRRIFGGPKGASEDLCEFCKVNEPQFFVLGSRYCRVCYEGESP